MSVRSSAGLRDQMLAAPEDIEQLPERFIEARAYVREAMVRVAEAGIPNETLVAVLMSEMLPRMVHDRGPLWTATVLAELAHQIGGGTAPTCTRQ